MFTFCDETMICGLTKHGFWVVETAEGIRSIFDGKSIYLAFPILEEDPNEFMQRFKREAEFLHMGADLVDNFPVPKLLAGALISEGSYQWPLAANNWIGKLQGLHFTDELVDAILVAIKRKSLPQKLRHSLRRRIAAQGIK